MSIQPKQLGQSRPADTNNSSIYSPEAGVVAVVKTLIIANSTAGAVAARVFLDDDGTTYDQSTSLLYDLSIPANDIKIYNLFLPMNNPSGNLAVRTASANALTFTALGVEMIS